MSVLYACYCLIYLWVRINAVQGNSVTANIVYSWSQPSREQGGEGRQTGCVVVLWAGSRKGNSLERPAWEWVSISDSLSKAPTHSFPLPLHPFLLSSPLCSQQLFFSAFFLSSSLLFPLPSPPSVPLLLRRGEEVFSHGLFPNCFHWHFWDISL